MIDTLTFSLAQALELLKDYDKESFNRETLITSKRKQKISQEKIKRTKSSRLRRRKTRTRNQVTSQFQQDQPQPHVNDRGRDLSRSVLKFGFGCI